MSPKKAKVIKLNDYRPVALASVVMKVLERLVLNYLMECTGPLRDPCQFAYQANRSVEDAVTLGLHHTLQHLEHPNSHARVLFMDFSSAFNTIILHKLLAKLLWLNFHPSIGYWILDFLLDHRQVVKVNNWYLGPRVLNTGAPQGCVLSPLLFTLFTNDSVSSDPSVLFVKFSNDTTVVGLVSDNDEGRSNVWLAGVQIITWSLTYQKLKKWSLTFVKCVALLHTCWSMGCRLSWLILSNFCARSSPVICHEPLTAPLLSKGVAHTSIFWDTSGTLA